MTDSLKFSLHRLRETLAYAQEKAFDETVSGPAKAAYSDVALRLSREIGELDYLLNLNMGDTS